MIFKSIAFKYFQLKYNLKSAMFDTQLQKMENIFKESSISVTHINPKIIPLVSMQFKNVASSKKARGWYFLAVSDDVKWIKVIQTIKFL